MSNPDPVWLVPLANVERAHIERILHHFKGNILKAAACLGIEPATIENKKIQWQKYDFHKLITEASHLP